MFAVIMLCVCENMTREVPVREISSDLIIDAIRKMCIEANLFLSDDVKTAVLSAQEKETSELGKRILKDLEKNLQIAGSERIPICQDTGMAVVFANVGQDVHITGMAFEDAVNEGIRRGYEEGYLRKSVVADPLERVNTRDNTPGIIHTRIVPGENIELTVAPKGFGSENMSAVRMLKPADGIEGVKKAVIEIVKEAGPNCCPPSVIGVGIGGDFEECALLAKKALTRELGSHSEKAHIALLEKDLFDEINKLGIGPAGLGGRVTTLGVNIETYPTHIAGLPLAVNICCHVNRHRHTVL